LVATTLAAPRQSRQLSPWVGFLVRRLIGLIAVLLGLLLATFMMVRLIPGDPALLVGGLTASGAELAAIRHELGVDQPAPTQFINYLSGLARGDMGRSFTSKQPVANVISERARPSAELAGAAFLSVMLLSVPLGILAGAMTREGQRPTFELGFTAVTSVVGSIPEFLMATFLAFIFAVSLRILPVAGSQGWQALVLPVAAISFRPIFTLARIVRLETLNTLAQDFIRTARSKRLSTRIIYLRHVLPNVLTAALTVGGILFSGLIAGAVLVENVFARLGLGTALVTAAVGHDYPVVQGIVLVLGMTVVIVNTVVDMALAAIDPRTLARQS
jgi:peptide/nickel transport system permease protein